MKVLSNLEFKNSTYILNKFEDFPENPLEGTVIFKENGLYIYSLSQISGNLEWINILDFTRTNTSFKFEQTSENIEWVINHNLNTQDLFVIVYDSNGNKQIESEIQFQSNNEIKLIFSEPISGKALLFGASVISSPSNMYTKEEIDELLKNIDTSGGNSNIILPENGTDGQVLIKDSSTESGLNWSDKIDGKSAYEVAKDEGFEGTEEEWLKSLKGVNAISYGINVALDTENKKSIEMESIEESTHPSWTGTATDNGLVVLTLSIPITLTLKQSSGISLTLNSNTINLQYAKVGSNILNMYVSKGDVFSIVDSSGSTSSTVTCSLYPYKQINTYSTDEQIVGTWIDGKPIYQRALSYTGTYSTSNPKHTICDVSSWNVDSWIDITGTNSFTHTSGHHSLRTLDYNIFEIGITAAQTSLYIKYDYANNTAGSTIKTNLIIKYTKTTD